MTKRSRYTKAVVLSALTSALMMSAAYGQSADGEAWPPALKPLPDNFGYMTPEESLETFTLPPGYDIELVASEPLMGDAIVMQWGYDGSLWLAETTYMVSEEELTTPTPESAIVTLRDTDGDGVMDERTEFASDLILPRAMLILEPGKILVAEPPNVLLLEDTDGDGVSDTREIVYDQYGARGGSIEHDPNGLAWNIDNRIYSAYKDVVFDWTGEGLDTLPGVDISQWGVGIDDEGRLFRQGNSEPPVMSYVADYYYGRNSFFSRERGSAEWIGGDTAETFLVFPARPTPGLNRGYVEGVLREDGTLTQLTSAGGLSVNRGTALPDDVYGDVFVPEPAANLVAQLTLEDTGSGILQQRAYEEAEFLTSTEERFRPILTGNGPDGAFYVLDLYHGIIQDAQYMTKYLYDWASEHELFDTHGLNGRVYRITHEDGEPSEVIDLTAASPEELVALLEHENGWYRDHAQRLIVVQQQADAVPALVELLASDAEPVARLHALWTLDGLGAVEPEMVVEALNGDEPMLRAAALRVAEQWLEEPDSPVVEAFLAVVDETDLDWRVKYQLAASAGELGEENRLDAIVAIIENYGDDFVALDAALSGVPDESVSDLLDALLAVETESEGVTNAINTVASAISTRGTAAQVSAMLDAIGAEDRSPWQREAAITGMEIALAGVDDPGEIDVPDGVETGSWDNPPLSDRAFPEYIEVVNANEAAAEAARNEADAVLDEGGAAEEGLVPALTEVDGIPTLVLEAEPEAFLALQDDPELADRIEIVTLLMSWPGKDE